MFGMLWVSLSC